MPTTSFPRHARDAGGRFVFGMARALVAGGHEVEVLAPEPRDGEAVIEPAPGVRVHWLPYFRPRRFQRAFHGAGAPDNLARDLLAWPSALVFGPRLALALRHRASRWDAVVSHWGVPSGLVVALACDLPHLAFFHSGDVHALERSGPFGRQAARILASVPDLAFVSRDLEARFAKLASPRRSHVIPMGVDASSRAREPRGARTTLLSLGRLVPIKGVDRAIDAIVGTEIELIVAGDGPERAALEERVRVRGARVRFVGFLDEAGKAEVFARCDALIAPSRDLGSGRTEGTPVAVLEAMAAGLPVIATRVGGLPELVRDGIDGWLVGDDAGLARAVHELAQDPERARRMGEAARSRPRSWDDVAARIETILSSSGFDAKGAQGAACRSPAGSSAPAAVSERCAAHLRARHRAACR